MELRLREHPILEPKKEKEIKFFFDGRPLEALDNEMISSALFAHGIGIFGKHPRDNAPQGIFCANGQCGQCLVLVDGIPKKACITPVGPEMKVETLVGLPPLPPDDGNPTLKTVVTTEIEVLIVGGGPAGIMAAQELGSRNVSCIIVDDKLELGGKLFLQSHNFFGSMKHCFAGKRGMEIGNILADHLAKLESVQIWLNSPVVGVFSDGKVGVVRNDTYELIKPDKIVMTTGAREKMLTFVGADLPGVYGAGAFQTIVNRDLVKAAKKLFIVGGGNVGLIAAYQALQAGIEVEGIVEALPMCGGYRVHEDKLRRLGIPIYNSHTILSASGKDELESVVIAAIDNTFKPIPGTEKKFHVDTLLVAVGLTPVDELLEKALAFGYNVYPAGDAEEIAEASAAIFSGRITGRKILKDMGMEIMIPPQWYEMLEILRNKPGPVKKLMPLDHTREVYPVLRCVQQIPCDPCTQVCPMSSISIRKSMEHTPRFNGRCIGCGRCVAICPGLAITLVDRRYDPDGNQALVVVPWEMPHDSLHPGEIVVTCGFEGEIVGSGVVVGIKEARWQNHRKLVALEVPDNEANSVAGIRMNELGQELEHKEVPREDEIPGPLDESQIILCRCERVTRREVLTAIREGCRDINALKATTRIGMGPCGGKTCIPLVKAMFRREGIELDDVKDHVERPFFQEIPLSVFLENKSGEQKGGEQE